MITHPGSTQVPGPGAVEFCVPPPRGGGAGAMTPPPLPSPPECRVAVGLAGTMSFRPVGDEWLVTYDSAPLSDAPAAALRGHEVVGAVHDLRWHGRAGVVKATHTTWKQKPGRA